MFSVTGECCDTDNRAVAVSGSTRVMPEFRQGCYYFFLKDIPEHSHGGLALQSRVRENKRVTEDSTKNVSYVQSLRLSLYDAELCV